MISYRFLSITRTCAEADFDAVVQQTSYVTQSTLNAVNNLTDYTTIPLLCLLQTALLLLVNDYTSLQHPQVLCRFASV